MICWSCWDAKTPLEKRVLLHQSVRSLRKQRRLLILKPLARRTKLPSPLQEIILDYLNYDASDVLEFFQWLDGSEALTGGFP
jgi:hypothetical protein